MDFYFDLFAFSHEFIFLHRIGFSHPLLTKLHCFGSLSGGDYPFSLSQIVLRECFKYAHSFHCVEICIEGKLCMLASGNEMYKVHDW